MKITPYQNLWDRTEAVLRGKVRADNATRKEKKFQINNLIFHLKTLGWKGKKKQKRKRERKRKK